MYRRRFAFASFVLSALVFASAPPRAVYGQPVNFHAAKHAYSVRGGRSTTNCHPAWKCPVPSPSPTPSQITHANNLAYNGGSVEASPRVVLDYWGPEWAQGFTTGGYSSAQAQTYLGHFFRGVGGSAWMNTNSQYCSGIAKGSQYCASSGIANTSGELLGTWNDTTPVPATPTDSDIASAAARAVSHFNDANAVYFVLTPTGKSESGFAANGGSWCAWHGFNTGYTNRPYAYLPYIPDARASCGMNWINANDSFGHGYFDGYSTVGGHEYGEAVTDPWISAWKDSAGNENGDKCAWNNTIKGNATLSTGYFAVQSLWSNAKDGCSLGPN